MLNSDELSKQSEQTKIEDPEPIDNVFEQNLERRILNDRTYLFLKTYSQVESINLPDEKDWEELKTEVKNITKHALIHRSQAYAKFRQRQPDIFSYAAFLPSNLRLVRNCFASDQPYSLMDLPHCTMPKVYDQNINNEAKLHTLDELHVDFKRVARADSSRIINLFLKRFESFDTFSTPFDPQEDKLDYYLINELFTLPEDCNINGITLKQEETHNPKFSSINKIGYDFALDYITGEPLSQEKRALVCPYQAEKLELKKKRAAELGVEWKSEEVVRNLHDLLIVRDPLELREEEFLSENELDNWVRTYVTGPMELSKENETEQVEAYKKHYSPLIGPIGKDHVKAHNRNINIVKKYKPDRALDDTRAKRDEFLDRLLESYKEQGDANISKNSCKTKESLIFEDTFKAMHDLAGSTSSKLRLDEVLSSLLQPNPNYDRIIEEGFHLARHGELFGLCAVAISYILRNKEEEGERLFRANFDKALIYLELAAANREPYSCYLLSYLASKDNYRIMQPKARESMIFTYLIRAADDGLDIAQIALAFKYRKLRDLELFGHYIMLAARQCHPVALFEGERVATRGMIDRPDPDLGWFMLAMYATYLPNDLRIFNKVGQKLMHSRLLEPDRNTNITAVKMMELAAYTSLEACYFAGLMYYDGSFVPEDLCKARYYFERSSQVGVHDSRVLLGAMYERGDGGPVDLKRSLELYRKAMIEDKLRMGAESYIELLLTLSIQSSYPFEAMDGFEQAKITFPNERNYWSARQDAALNLIEQALYDEPFIRNVVGIYINVHNNTPEIEERISNELARYLQKKTEKEAKSQ